MASPDFVQVRLERVRIVDLGVGGRRRTDGRIGAADREARELQVRELPDQAGGKPELFRVVSQAKSVARERLPAREPAAHVERGGRVEGARPVEHPVAAVAQQRGVPARLGDVVPPEDAARLLVRRLAVAEEDLVAAVDYEVEPPDPLVVAVDVGRREDVVVQMRGAVAGGARRGEEARRLLRNGVDPAGGDLVSGKRRAGERLRIRGQRIVDLDELPVAVEQAREIAVELRGERHRLLRRVGGDLAQPLVREEEEESVAQVDLRQEDRAAEREAERVVAEWGSRFAPLVRRPVVGVELVVLQMLVGAAVE